MLGENISSGCGFGCLSALNSPQTTGATGERNVLLAECKAPQGTVPAPRHGFRIHPGEGGSRLSHTAIVYSKIFVTK
jgi:hypothetical protein